MNIRSVRTCRATITMVVSLSVLLVASSATAQQPVCPPLQKDQPTLVVCRPQYTFAALRFLRDFTVDHLFKPIPWSFDRSMLSMGQNFAGDVLTLDEEMTRALALVPPVHFKQLDRTTGTISGDFKQVAPRELRSTASDAGAPTLTMLFPERLEGGYWRGPDALQIAFWQGKRIGVRIDSGNRTVVNGELACLSLSPDALELSFLPAGTPAVSLLLRGCE